MYAGESGKPRSLRPVRHATQQIVPRGILAPLAVVTIAAALGALVAISPVMALAATAGMVGLGLLSLGRAMVPVFHLSVVAILAGYAFLGRGLAHLGAPPIYVGEVVLGIAVIAIAVSLSGARWSYVHLALAAFCAWGLVRTLPFIGSHGLDALRDAVAWGYAIFAVAISLTVRPEHFEAILRLYRRATPMFVLWVPLAAVLAIGFSGLLPRAPGSEVPIVVFKGGDMGVHLAGVGAFMILGLGGGAAVAFRDVVVWTAWLMAVVTAGAVNRGGLLAASMMLASIAFVRVTARWFVLVFVGLLLVTVAGLADPRIDLGLSRRISVDQIVANVTSIFDSRAPEGLEGTKQWRLRWWNTILGYTLDGPHFWLGKGFGVNLADDDGFQLTADHSLRAPHNGHLEILARSGVPGLSLWVLVQLAFGAALIRAAMRAWAAGLRQWVAITGWILAYWLASLVNASFDVYLQGPQGGIWYWAIIGLGIAAVTSVNTLTREDPTGQISRGGRRTILTMKPGTMDA